MVMCDVGSTLSESPPDSSQSDSEGSVSSGETLHSHLHFAQPAPVKCRWSGCGEWFTQLEMLAGHVTMNHAVPGKGGLFYCHWESCNRSDRGFNARYKMLVHMRTHTNEKPHHCFQCDKSFSRAENLKIHARSHTGERPYVCPVVGCGKAYSNSSDRFKHTRTHSIDKPYVCKVAGCSKRYTDPSSLRKHVKTYRHYPTTNPKDSKMEGDKITWKSDLEKRLSVPSPLTTSLLSSNYDISQAYTPNEDSQKSPMIAEACYDRTSVLIMNRMTVPNKTEESSKNVTNAMRFSPTQNVTCRISSPMITEDLHGRVQPQYAEQVRHSMPPPLYIDEFGHAVKYEPVFNMTPVTNPYFMFYGYSETAPTYTQEQEMPLDLSVHH